MNTKNPSLIVSLTLASCVQFAHGQGIATSPLQGGTTLQAPVQNGLATGSSTSQANPLNKPQPGGPTVNVSTIRFVGNTLLNADTLSASLGEATGKPYDLHGMWQLAEMVEIAYRQRGYPFTQAWIEPQNLENGNLTITVLEGRYGKITVVEKGDLPEGAQAFLDEELHPGEPIQSNQLERVLLLLDDQPGVKVQPLLRPGNQKGEGDLIADVQRLSNVSGEVGLDNIGSKSTGLYRTRGTVNINSPFTFGDRITMSGMYTSENMFLGSAEYDTPLNASGLRGGMGYAHTSYVLGGDFAALGGKGIADITNLRLSYPILRSQISNLWASIGVQHKKLHDQYEAIPLDRFKMSNSVPISLQFDHRDLLGGGGITYGFMTWTTGQLHLDGSTAVGDAQSALTQGNWQKWNLDIARIQNLPGDWRLYGRLSSQWSSKNLDPSEKMGVAGFYGVRAYPMGESMSDQATMGQLELRYLVGAWTPFVFYDSARAEINRSPWTSSAANVRQLAARGLGIRYQEDGWSLDSSLAWSALGGPAVSETDRSPRFFVMLTKKF
jgi:hemolysin activation/secretion protein